MDNARAGLVDLGTLTLLAQTVGPFALMMLVALFLVLRYGPRRGADPQQIDTYHAQNQETLERMERSIGHVEGEVRVGLRRVEEQLLKVNGRIGKIEEWREAHDKQDDERYSRHQEVAHDIVEEVKRVREHVHETRGLMQPLVTDFDLRRRG